MARRLMQRGRPHSLGFGRLATGSEATRLHEARNEGLQAAGARVTDAGLPGLDGARARPCSIRELALRQAAAPSKA